MIGTEVECIDSANSPEDEGVGQGARQIAVATGDEQRMVRI